MARETLYCFTLENGTLETMTLNQAWNHESEAVKKRAKEILFNIKNRRRVKDGFTPGIQESTGKYAGGPREFQKQLRSMGLVQIDKKDVPGELIDDTHPMANEEIAKTVVEQFGPENGVWAEAIKDGSYFKDTSTNKGE